MEPHGFSFFTAVKISPTIICEREEIFNNKIKVLEETFLLSEYQFHILIENKDTQLDDFASKIFFVGIGVGLQLVVILCFVCYYQLVHKKDMVDSTLSQLDKNQFGLLLLCMIIAIVLKIVGKYVKSERKELIKKIKSHFKK